MHLCHILMIRLTISAGKFRSPFFYIALLNILENVLKSSPISKSCVLLRSSAFLYIAAGSMSPNWLSINIMKLSVIKDLMIIGKAFSWPMVVRSAKYVQPFATIYIDMSKMFINRPLTCFL